VGRSRFSGRCRSPSPSRPRTSGGSDRRKRKNPRPSRTGVSQLSPVLLLLLVLLGGSGRALGRRRGSRALRRSRSALGARSRRRSGRAGGRSRRRVGFLFLLLGFRHDVADLGKIEDRLTFLPALLLLQEIEALGPRQDVAMAPEISGGDETFVDGHK